MANEFNYMCNEDLVRTISGTKENILESEEVNNSLTKMANMTEEELCSIKGVGKATAKKILAAFELGRRLLSEKTERKDLGSSIALYQHLKPLMSHLDRETAYLVIMNQNFKEIKTVKLSEGGLTETAIDVRVIMRNIVTCNGTIFAIAHNHPSNNATPSKNDKLITAQIAKAAEVMRLFFMDHVIISNEGFYSFHDHGVL